MNREDCPPPLAPIVARLRSRPPPPLVPDRVFDKAVQAREIEILIRFALEKGHA